MKFGGTSVGSVNSILNLKSIVENAAKTEPIIVVVSALGGVTDKLIKISKYYLLMTNQQTGLLNCVINMK